MWVSPSPWRSTRTRSSTTRGRRELIHGLVGRLNFGINPDLGNLLWTYDVPEESLDDCIRKLATISVYWHCKNLFRVYHPEMQRSVFLRVPLPDGEIDYRFALSAMRAAGYSGYMPIEGASTGDQFHADQKSLTYAKAVWTELGRTRRRRGTRQA